jgi:hypothetical protein
MTTTDPKSPAQHASDAAESIRALNHATLSVGDLDWEFPSHAYDVIGGLERATSYLPQALEQVGKLLSGLAADGHVGSTTGNPEQDLAGVRLALVEARAAAMKLSDALQQAHNATSPLTYED